jgi:hypothetical protein
MYPVKSAFIGLEGFDIRFSLGSDRDHNLASTSEIYFDNLLVTKKKKKDGILVWVLQNIFWN